MRDEHFQLLTKNGSRDNSSLSKQTAHGKIAKFAAAYPRLHGRLKEDTDYQYSKELVDGYINARMLDEDLCESAIPTPRGRG